MDTTVFQLRATRLNHAPNDNEQRVTIETTNVLTVGLGTRDRAALSACLWGPRWRLLHADDVNAAIDLMTFERFHAVISDVNLPDGHWLELRQRLESVASRLPIIIATESLDAPLWAEALSHGAYDVLLKPFQPEEVLYVIQTVCLHRHGMKVDAAPWRQAES